MLVERILLDLEALAFWKILHFRKSIATIVTVWKLPTNLLVGLPLVFFDLLYTYLSYFWCTQFQKSKNEKDGLCLLNGTVCQMALSVDRNCLLNGIPNICLSIGIWPVAHIWSHFICIQKYYSNIMFQVFTLWKLGLYPIYYVYQCVSACTTILTVSFSCLLWWISKFHGHKKAIKLNFTLLPTLCNQH